MKEVRNFRESINKKHQPNIITYKEKVPQSAVIIDKRTYRITVQFTPSLQLMSQSAAILLPTNKLNHLKIQNSKICKNLRNHRISTHQRTKILDSNTFKFLLFQPKTLSPNTMTFLISKKITKKKPRINNGAVTQTPVVIHLSIRWKSSQKKPVSSWLKFSHWRLHLCAIILQQTTSPHTIQVMTETRSKYNKMIVCP